jgi:CubicO group peptidase (beta-lactamase class C family)
MSPTSTISMPRAFLALLAPALLLQACASTATPAPQSSAVTTPANQVVTAAAKRRIDSTLRAYVDSGRVAGASALVWEKGREVYFGAFGMADREANRPMTRDVIAQIFSMTKPITGVAMMQLWEQGRFKLDDPSRRTCPSSRTSASTPGAMRPRRRWRRRAGRSRSPTSRATPPDSSPTPTRRGRSALPHRQSERPEQHHHPVLAEARHRATRVSAGTRWSYGISVDVQAALVERVSGQPFGRYVREHILDPLKMRETRYLVPEADRARFAAMYQRNAAGALVRAPDSTAKAFNTKPWALEPGAFGFTSTLDDYMRFARMLLNGGELDGVRILRPETVRLMATNHLPATVRDSSFLTGKGQVGFGIDFAVRHSPPKSAAEMNGCRRRVLLGWRREHALLGRSGESAHGRAVHAGRAVRLALAQDLPRRRVRADRDDAVMRSVLLSFAVGLLACAGHRASSRRRVPRREPPYAIRRRRRRCAAASRRRTRIPFRAPTGRSPRAPR